MASWAENLDEKKFKKQTACVLGGTGEVGKEVVKTLLESKIFRQVVMIGRREVDYSGDPLRKEAIQRVVDFDKLAKHKEAFEGCDVVFSCLGTTRGKAGAEGFYKVDHDYVLESARIAKESGCKQFNLVTSVGANKDSYLLYPQTKGKVEHEVSELGFPRLSIFRPAMLMCDRVEQRTVEKIIRTLMKPLEWIAPTWMTVPTVTVAKGMIINMWNEGAGKVQIVENRGIHELGNEFDKHFGTVNG